MNDHGGVLTLDLSTHTGWVCGHPGEADPPGGVWHLPNMAFLGKCFVALDNEMHDALALLRPRLVAYEAALPIYDRSTELLFGLTAIVQAACYRASVKCEPVSVSDARAAVLGRKRFPPDLAKAFVLNFCRMEGYEPDDDNHGDAYVLWRYKTRDMLPFRRAA